MGNPFSEKVAIFAHTNSREPYKIFGIKQRDRLAHMYIIGKTGTGKSTLLETLIHQDIWNGNGLCLIDPHGDLVERIYENIPWYRKADVIYFNVPDLTQPYGYNPLRFVQAEKRTLAASGLLEVMKKMWPDAWGVNMEHILRNALLALLETPGSSMKDIQRLLSDKWFRREIAKQLSNEQVRNFWAEEYDKQSLNKRSDGAAPILNKVGAFLADPNIHRILTEPDQDLHFRQIMDEGKILLVNLAKGQIGEDAAGLLGGMLTTTIGLAAFSRQDIPEEKRKDFFLYLDEFQNFTTKSMANMTSELRKYKVGMVLAHQYLTQLDMGIRDAVLGNAGTLITFRLGAKDAGFIQKELQPIFSTLDILNLPNHQIYLRLMIDGAPSQPFSGITLPVTCVRQ